MQEYAQQIATNASVGEIVCEWTLYDNEALDGQKHRYPNAKEK